MTMLHVQAVAMKSIDVVVPYRESVSGELIYMLRSLKNIDHGQVFVIGDNPKLSKEVIHIPYNQTPDIAQNTLNIMNIACRDPRISDNFIWMHDDFYIMRKLDRIPIYHRGPYSRILSLYKLKNKQGYYIRRMENTYRKLNLLGIANPLCYELHVPFVINKNKWLKVSSYINKDLNKLSMYGNLNRIGGVHLKDVKVRAKDLVPAGNFISTYDATFGSNKAGDLIRELFSERSIYEK